MIQASFSDEIWFREKVQINHCAVILTCILAPRSAFDSPAYWSKSAADRGGREQWHRNHSDMRGREAGIWLPGCTEAKHRRPRRRTQSSTLLHCAEWNASRIPEKKKFRHVSHSAGRSKGGRFQRRVKKWLRNAYRTTIELWIKQAQKLINRITCFSWVENWLSGDWSPGTNKQDLESNIWRRIRDHIVRRRVLCFL